MFWGFKVLGIRVKGRDLWSLYCLNKKLSESLGFRVLLYMHT